MKNFSKVIVLIIILFIINMQSVFALFPECSPSCPKTTTVTSEQYNLNGCTYTVVYDVYDCNNCKELLLVSVNKIGGSCTNTVPEVYNTAIKAMISDADNKYGKTLNCVSIYSQTCWRQLVNSDLVSCGATCCMNYITLSHNGSNNLVVLSNTPSMTGLDCSQQPPTGGVCTDMCGYIGLETNVPLIVNFTTNSQNTICDEDCFWKLDGNLFVNPNNFMGSINFENVILKSNNYERMRIRAGAQNEAGTKVNIGQLRPVAPNDDYMLSVNGKIVSKEIVVVPPSDWIWPDYVFEEGYKLMTLEELENQIQINRHLPEIPSSENIVKDGLNLSEMNRILVKKMEEMTLYLIELNKQNTMLQKRLDQLELNTNKR